MNLVKNTSRKQTEQENYSVEHNTLNYNYELPKKLWDLYYMQVNYYRFLDDPSENYVLDYKLLCS